MKIESAADTERILQRELMACPECGEEVRTHPAEGVPAQTLRSCNQCGGVFLMDVESEPVYVEDVSDNE